jgi:hypothetical protein
MIVAISMVEQMVKQMEFALHQIVVVAFTNLNIAIQMILIEGLAHLSCQKIQ